MLNIYGEKVRLTEAQEREYVRLLDGAVTVQNSNTQLLRVYNALKVKGFVRVSYVYANATKFERWM